MRGQGLLGGLLLVLAISASPTSAQVAVPPTAGSAPLDDRYGVVLAGTADDGAPATSQSAEVLKALGVRWWYAFSEDAPLVPGTHRMELARPTSPLGQVIGRARQHPGAMWLMGNEPNVPGQDDVLPGEFAVWLRQTTAAIRQADPTARFVGPNALNWDVTCTACAGYTSAHEWSDRFLEAYRVLYDEDPPLDAWGMHVYDVDWANPPLVHTRRGWEQIEGARAWLEEQPTLAGKPIWLSEFGVIFGYDGYDLTQVDGKPLLTAAGSLREELLSGYVADMVGWLTTRGTELRVQKWFLYSAFPAREPYQAQPAGVALLRGTSGALHLTTAGQTYIAPPQVAPSPTADPLEPSVAPDADTEISSTDGAAPANGAE